MQEGQLAKNDWASWRVFLADERFRRAVPLPVRTHGGSRSFANPFIALVPGPPSPRFFVSVFLASQGSAPGETGALVYLTDAP